MIEDMLPLTLPPGLAANGTIYERKGRWINGNLIRFFEGRRGPIGGWTPVALTGAAVLGTAHATVSWRTPTASWMAIGTTQGLYVVSDTNVVTSILPAGLTAPYTWQLSTLGHYLVAVLVKLGTDTPVKTLYVWAGDTASPAVLAWSTDAGPVLTYGAFTTAERFLVSLRGEDGAGMVARSGIDPGYSAARVYWASQETYDEYVPTDTNTAGSFDLTTDGRLLYGSSAKGESLLWTDNDLWRMAYIGGDFIYSFQQVSKACGLISRRAAVVLDDGAYWMGRGKFFKYDGAVQPIPCEVTDYVFGNFNEAQADAVWVLPVTKYSELTWYYPALGSSVANRYVTYNYKENHWTFGALERHAGVPVRFLSNAVSEQRPQLLLGASLYQHEDGNVRQGASAFLESGPVELGRGDRLTRVQGIMPDDIAAGDVSLTLSLSMAPDGAETTVGPYSLEAFTPLRKTARQVRLRFDEVHAVDWRLGTPRLAVLPAERRGTPAPGLDPRAASIEITPSTVTIEAGQVFQYTAIVRNAAGQVLDLQPDQWTTTDAADVEVTTAGQIFGAAVGAATIQALLHSPPLSSNTSAVVVVDELVASIVLSPTTETMQVFNGAGPLVATAYNAEGAIVAASIEWEVADPTKITVSPLGTAGQALISGIAPGATTVKAKCGLVESNACAVTVTDTWRVHVFTGNGSFNVTSAPAGVTPETLAVGGGGSGGSVDGVGVVAGGGGAGGVLHTAAQAFSVGAWPVFVGAGGISPHANHAIAGGSLAAINGNPGTDTKLLNPSGTVVQDAIGGGGGGAGSAGGRAGGAGGSGGGGGSATDGWSGGPGTVGQGNAGGAGMNASNAASGGGGGGASSGGTNGSLSPAPGGAGAAYDIENVPGGTTKTYGQGGGSGDSTTHGAANSGNGGGGGTGAGADGGYGGSGIFVVRYRRSSGFQATGGVISDLSA